MEFVNSSAFATSKQASAVLIECFCVHFKRIKISASLHQITSAPVYKLAVIEKAVQLQRNHHSIICLDVAVKNKNFLIIFPTSKMCQLNFANKSVMQSRKN
ncbi:chloroplastic,6,7-dimethyl-8-ribityllumazine synthase [Trichinella spiralis]|uniref:Chloroplastic,6,7-dimethyl-8-ribityllumazine synthase n=1 Tax=Trichinella spiralis TaxID=6334 RepID=A0ABR3KRI6_TRISP